MRRFLVLFLMFFVMFSGIVKAEQTEETGVKSDHLYIPDKTMFAVELVNSVSSNKTFVGEALEISVLENVVVDNKIVIEEGAIGYVVVSDVRKASDWGKAGSIEIQPKYVRSVNFTMVPLVNGINKSGDDHEVVHPLSVGAIGKRLSGALLKFGSIFLIPDFSPGKNAEIPAGTEFIVAVDGNIDLMDSAGAAGSVIESMDNNKICWTGKYNTSRGKMLLTQDGNRVTGLYDLYNGKLEGRVVGNQLVGQWTEDKTETNPKRTGSFEIKLEQGEDLILKWRDDKSDNWVIDPYVAKL